MEKFRIFAFLGNRALGDFIFQNAFAASVKQQVGNADLTLYFADDRPYKKPVVSLNSHADRDLATEPNAVVPLNWFDNAADPPVKSPHRPWYGNRLNEPNLVLTPSMMRWQAMGAFSTPARLRLAPADQDQQTRALAAAGVDPSRWFATVHTKEQNYKFRKDTGPGRAVDPATYETLSDFIIDELGGQVVRLGDPSMHRFTPRPGLVDLSLLEDRFLLHACAVQHSRFLIAADSGIHPLGSAMGVPTAVTNLLSPGFCWNSHDILLSKTVITPDGRRLRQQDASAAGVLDENVVFHGHRVEDCTTAELKAVAQMLYEDTRNCRSWRKPAEIPPANATSQRPVMLPFPEQVKARWFAV